MRNEGRPERSGVRIHGLRVRAGRSGPPQAEGLPHCLPPQLFKMQT
jgi:hypothetical protein